MGSEFLPKGVIPDERLLITREVIKSATVGAVEDVSRICHESSVEWIVPTKSNRFRTLGQTFVVREKGTLSCVV